MSGNRAVVWLGLFFFLSGFTGGSVARKVEEGNRLFKEGDYEAALNRYSEAQTERPDSPEILFNMGDGLYRLKQYKEAIDAHTRALSPQGKEKGSLDAKAHYNMGNSLFRQNNLESALEAYKRAIDLDSGDIDTKYNIEFIQRQMKEKKSQDQKRSQDQHQQQLQEKQEEGGGQQQDREEGSQGGEQEEKEKPGESEKETKSPQKEEKQGPSPQRPSIPPQEISKEDAERLLGAFQSEEKNLPLPLKEGERPFTETPPEKDW